VLGDCRVALDAWGTGTQPLLVLVPSFLPSSSHRVVVFLSCCSKLSVHHEQNTYLCHQYHLVHRKVQEPLRLGRDTRYGNVETHHQTDRPTGSDMRD
jgi:hypothetical protein